MTAEQADVGAREISPGYIESLHTGPDKKP
jgi:peptidyl-tRNA hydrolase